MGAPAETELEKWLVKKKLPYVKRGWDKPPLPRFYDLHPYDRGYPDYTVELPKKYIYIEVKGTTDKTVKIKLSALEVMEFWRGFHEVHIFVWNSKTKQFKFLNFDDVIELVPELAIEKFENDGHEYVNYPVWE